MSGILPRDENHVTAVGFESSSTAGLILPGQINEVTGRILTSMTGGGSGTVQDVSVATANGFAGTSDGDPVDPVLTLTTTITGILKGNGTAVSAVTVGSGLSFDGTTLSATGGGSGDVVGPASATDNAITRYDGTTGKLIQDYTSGAPTISDTGAVTIPLTSGNSLVVDTDTLVVDATNNRVGIGTNTPDTELHVLGTAGGGFGYVIATIENTSSGGRAELALTTDDGPFAGFLAMAGSATTNSARQMDIGTRVAGDISFWTTDTERLTLDAAGTSLYPTFTNTLALGSATNMWADLFLASGGVINWNNGNVTLTHAAGKLTLAGGDFTVTAAETPINAINTTDSASVEGLNIEGDRATPAANDEIYQTFRLSDSAGNQTAFARIVTVATSVTDTLETAELKLQIISAGTLATRTVFTPSSIRPNANDGLALGSATVSFADLFLASGGVINWANGNAVLTHSSGLLTVSTGAFAVGNGTITSVTGGVTISGSAGGSFNVTDQVYTSNTNISGAVTFGSNATTNIGTTGTRAAKLWATDGEFTNVPTAGGVAIPTISSTNTLTNKRITKRTGTTTSSATPTINTDNVDEYYITAQTTDITSFTTNLSGTPTLGQTLFISVIGTAARAITWGASFANGPVALPTTTVTTTQLSVLLKWDGSIWRCYATGSTV